MQAKLNTKFERCKFEATTQDLTEIKILVKNTDVIESCTNERTNTNWIFYKSTNVTALLREVPIGCKDTILPDPVMNKQSAKDLEIEQITWKPYKDNLGIFRALELHLHGKERLERETSILLIFYLEQTGGTDPATFRGVYLEEIATVENNAQTDIFLYDIDIVVGSVIGELARRSVGNYSNTVRIIRSNCRIC